MRKFATAAWVTAAFLGALALVGGVYGAAGSGDRLAEALRITGRWSFLWFCLATWGASLAVLGGERFRTLAARGRDFGLAFAAGHLVHVALVGWFLASATKPFPRPQLIFFGIGVFWTYLLALLSLSPALRAALSPAQRKFLHRTGVEYLSLTFAFDFTTQVFAGNLANAIHYLPLAVAAWSGPGLRLLVTFRTSVLSSEVRWLRE